MQAKTYPESFQKILYPTYSSKRKPQFQSIFEG